MVKNIPTIERSTKIRFGKYATDDQGENTIVFNASNAAIDTSVPGSIYMTPLRQEDDITSRDITMLTYNTETKEIIDSNVPAVDLFSINLQYVTNNDNVTSNTVRFINDTTSFVTTGNVGIQNTSPTHALDIGSKFHVTEGGEVRIGPSVLIDSDADNNIQVSGRINTNSITVNRIGLSNTNPAITGLSLGSTTFLQHPTASINAFSTTGNVSAAFYHGDSYFLSNLNLDNIILQGNTAASKTVEFNKSGTSLITASNVGIANALPVHTLDVGSNLFVDDKGSNKLVVTGNTFTSRKVLIGSNVTIDTLGSNVVEVTGNTFTSRKALVGSNLVMDTLGSNVVEVTGNTFTSRKALVGSNVTIDTLGSNVIEVTGNTFTSRKALIGSNVTIDTLGTDVVEVTGNVNVSNYTKTDYITVQKDAHVKGNLLVEGTTTTIDTINTTFGDAVISLANNNTETSTDIGIIMKQPGSNASPTVTFRGDEKEIMIGYTLNNSLDTEITPDYANVIDLHVYGNVIAQNNITLTSGELTAITLNGNVIGNNVDVITLTGNVIGNNVDVITLNGNVVGNNVDVITLTGNVVGNNVDVITLYGNVVGNNVDVITLNGNVIGNNVDVITLNGNVIGNNVDVITLYGNVVGNNVDVITLNGNVIADNVRATNNIETTSGFFKGNGGILSNVTLQQVTDTSNSTTNTIASTNTTTGFVSSGNVHVGSNIQVSGLTSGFVPIVGSDKFLRNSVIEYSGDTTTISSNVEITGNLLVLGNTFTIESNSLVINDRVLGIANNNVSHSLDVGIIMGHPGHNIAFIHHGEPVEGDPHEHEMVLGYTQSTVSDNHVLDDANIITFRVLGNVIVQNNLTLTSGDLTAITVNSNVVGNNVNVITLNGNVIGNNVDVITLYGNVIGNNVDVITLYGNVIGNNVDMITLYGNVIGNNVDVITLNGNVVGNNVDVITLYGNVIGNNVDMITLNGNVSGDNVNAITLYGNVIGNNVDVITLNGNVVGNNVDVITLYGNVSGDNVSVITLNGNVSGDNVSVITLNGNVVGNNVDVITLNGNVVGDNVSAITLYGNVIGNNVDVITLNGNVVGNNVDVITLYGNVSGDNVSVITLNGNVVGDNVSVITLNGNVVADNIYGSIYGSNTISASNIYVGTGTPSLGDYELRVEGDTEITGNLLVGGTTTTVNTTNLIVKDPIIQLGDASASVDSGLLLARPITVPVTGNVYVGYDQTESEFVIGFTDNHAGESSISVKDGVNFKMNVYGNVEASYFFGDGSQLSGIQTATPTLASVVDEGNATSNVVLFTNTTTGIEITSNIDFLNKITLKSTSGTKSNLFVVNAIQLDPSYAEPTRNVLSYDTTTGEIYDSGGQGGSSFVNITEEAANVLIGSNLTINTFGFNVLTVSGNVSADNITIGGLNVAASPFALDDVVSVYEGANVTANVLTLGGLVTSGNVDAGNITISGNTTSQNIKLTNTDISATISSGTITIDAKEKSYGTAPLVVSTTDVSNLIFSNLITGAQIVVPILASGGAINISKEMTNVNFYAMTTDVSVTQDKHALMTLSNLYGNIYMNAIGFA
jgi:hypothetical protein